MPRSGPGSVTGRPNTSTSPQLGGCCGGSPATRRRMVLLPQPDGPSTQTNSPLPGRSATTKLTLQMAVYALGLPALYVLVTLRNSTTFGVVTSSGRRTLFRTALRPTGLAPAGSFGTAAASLMTASARVG